MSNQMTCTRCESAIPGVEGFIPFVGELKARIAAEICNGCWLEWKDLQIKIINEYKLHMGEPEHRKVLDDHANKFFRFDGGDGTLSSPGPEGGLLGDPNAAG